jgi:hypothetical protein
MMYQANFSKRFKKEYDKFCKSNRNAADEIDLLIPDILSHPRVGRGKPECLEPKLTTASFPLGYAPNGNDGNWGDHVGKRRR